MQTLKSAGTALITLSALSHFAFLYLEMFLWTKPAGMKIFRRTEAQAKDSAGLAANQGLYNGFLAAGLTWSLFHPDAIFARELAIFFLGCVVVAGVFGAATVSRRILYIQALPAAIALLIVLISGGP